MSDEFAPVLLMDAQRASLGRARQNYPNCLVSKLLHVDNDEDDDNHADEDHDDVAGHHEDDDVHDEDVMVMVKVMVLVIRMMMKKIRGCLVLRAQW